MLPLRRARAFTSGHDSSAIDSQTQTCRHIAPPPSGDSHACDNCLVDLAIRQLSLDEDEDWVIRPRQGSSPDEHGVLHRDKPEERRQTNTSILLSQSTSSSSETRPITPLPPFHLNKIPDKDATASPNNHPIELIGGAANLPTHQLHQTHSRSYVVPSLRQRRQYQVPANLDSRAFQAYYKAGSSSYSSAENTPSELDIRTPMTPGGYTPMMEQWSPHALLIDPQRSYQGVGEGRLVGRQSTPNLFRGYANGNFPFFSQSPEAWHQRPRSGNQDSARYGQSDVNVLIPALPAAWTQEVLYQEAIEAVMKMTRISNASPHTAKRYVISCEVYSINSDTIGEVLFSESYEASEFIEGLKRMGIKSHLTTWSKETFKTSLADCMSGNMYFEGLPKQFQSDAGLKELLRGYQIKSLKVVHEKGNPQVPTSIGFVRLESRGMADEAIAFLKARMENFDIPHFEVRIADSDAQNVFRKVADMWFVDQVTCRLPFPSRDIFKSAGASLAKLSPRQMLIGLMELQRVSKRQRSPMGTERFLDNNTGILKSNSPESGTSQRRSSEGSSTTPPFDLNVQRGSSESSSTGFHKVRSTPVLRNDRGVRW